MPESRNPMADNNSTSTMSEAEISAIKETLCAQQMLLQKLSSDLDAEREASATAASEALSVILRLQGEKAAVKMEAEQFKRLAEEKMCHAEEYFAIIEDIIYQKEMEVADLHYQVQSYRYKLLSMGTLNPGVGEIKLPENLLQRNEYLAADYPSLQSIGRRNSLPVMFKSKKAVTEIREEESSSPSVDDETSQELNESVTDLEKKTESSTRGGINCYGEEIRELNIRVKEIAGPRFTSLMKNDNVSSSLPSRLSAGNLCYLASLHNRTLPPSPHQHEAASKINEIDQIKLPSIQNSKGSALDEGVSPNVHDVFEVPQAESSSKEQKEEASDGIESEKNNHLVQPEAVKVYAKDDEQPDWLRKVLLKHSSSREKNLCTLGDFAAASTSAAESQPGMDQINRTSGEVYQRIAETTNRDEELKLLQEILEKINTIHDEVRSLKVKNVRDRTPSSPLPEAMLSFWL